MSKICLEKKDLVTAGWPVVIFSIYFFELVIFFNNFFSFSGFLQQHKDTAKSNNKKNNYINQLLRSSLLKNTHRERNNTNNDKPSFQEKRPYNTPGRDLHVNSQRIGAVNCCRKDLDPRHFYVSAN